MLIVYLLSLQYALADYFLIFLILFSIGLIGLIFTRRSFIITLILLDLLLISCSFIFTVTSLFLGTIDGYFYALFLLVVAAAETSIGLGLMVVLRQAKNNTSLEACIGLRG